LFALFPRKQRDSWALIIFEKMGAEISFEKGRLTLSDRPEKLTEYAETRETRRAHGVSLRQS